MKKFNNEIEVNMRLQKPYATKEILNDISHKKIHRRINT